MPNEKQITPIIQSLPQTNHKKRIAAYCRVSTQADEQLHSLAAQRDFYGKSLADKPDVEFVGIYADRKTVLHIPVRHPHNGIIIYSKTTPFPHWIWGGFACLGIVTLWFFKLVFKAKTKSVTLFLSRFFRTE